MIVWNLEGRYLILVETPGGNLEVSLTDEGRELLADADLERPDFDLFADLFDDFASNGWTILTPEDIGALTDCRIIITPDVDMDDDGTITDCGPVYWHEDYQVQCFVTDLLAKDSVRLVKV